MHLRKGDKKFGQALPPPLTWTKSKRGETFFRETFPKGISFLQINSSHTKSYQQFDLVLPSVSTDILDVNISDILDVNISAFLLS